MNQRRRQSAADLARGARQAVIGSTLNGTPFSAADQVEALASAQAANPARRGTPLGRDGALYFRLGRSRLGGPDVLAGE